MKKIVNLKKNITNVWTSNIETAQCKQCDFKRLVKIFKIKTIKIIPGCRVCLPCSFESLFCIKFTHEQRQQRNKRQTLTDASDLGRTCFSCSVWFGFCYHPPIVGPIAPNHSPFCVFPAWRRDNELVDQTNLLLWIQKITFELKRNVRYKEIKKRIEQCFFYISHLRMVS